jgi:NADP-dependent 3-hydroxy acid dehydrogenase YdfG
MSRTIAVLGAGTGLGTAVAHRFGREGHRVALVARNADRLSALTAELLARGIEAAPFPADLTRPAEAAALVARVESRLGPIDTVHYAPITTDLLASAAGLTGDIMQHYLNLYLLTPLELIATLLPAMRARRDGAILLTQGISAVRPTPTLGGLGPAMAAARNHILALNAELDGTGVFAGVLHIGAMVTGSAGHRAAVEGRLVPGLDVSKIPQVDPADIAETLWAMQTTRDRAELTLPAVTPAPAGAPAGS